MKIYILRNPYVDSYIEEYVRNAEYHLNKKGYVLERISECTTLQEKDTAIVFFFWTSFGNEFRTFPQHTYVFMNTEQLTRPDQLQQVRAYLEAHPRMLYSDYSTANLKILQTDRPAAHLPFVYQPAYSEQRSLPKVVPLLFYGAMSSYRKEICEKYNAHVISHFGTARDRMIRMSACVLNAHYMADYQVFESMRVYHAIYLGTPVFLADPYLEEDLVLSPTAKKYLLTTLDVPPLPPLDPAEETSLGEQAIDKFISCLSLPKPSDP